MTDFIISVIFYIVFGAIIVIIFAPFWFPFSYRLPDNGYSEFQRKMNTNIIFSSVLIALLIAGITPISEYMKCNEDFICSIHKEYQIPFSNKQRNIKIDKDSYLGVIEEYHISYLDNRNRRRSYVTKYNDKIQSKNKSDLKPLLSSENVDFVNYYLALYNSAESNTQIFKNISASSTSSYIGVSTYETQMIQKSIDDFEAYKKNPKRGFYAKSLLNRGRLNMRLFLCSIFAIILLLLNRKIDIKEFYEKIRLFLDKVNR